MDHSEVISCNGSRIALLPHVEHRLQPELLGAILQKKETAPEQLFLPGDLAYSTCRQMPELSQEQKKHLKHWERRMRLTGAVMGTIFFMFLAFGWITQNVSMIIYVYLALFSVALLWGTHVRFAERCPNCKQRIGSWFGMQAYFGLPPTCKKCGVSFK